MSVVCGQSSTDFKVGHDREIDEETEDAGAKKVPETNSGEKHHRPVMRKGSFRLRALRSAQLQEAPGLECKEGQRYDFRGREERSQRHVQSGFAGEVHMMHAADDAARGIQNNVQID